MRVSCGACGWNDAGPAAESSLFSPRNVGGWPGRIKGCAGWDAGRKPQGYWRLRSGLDPGGHPVLSGAGIGASRKGTSDADVGARPEGRAYDPVGARPEGRAYDPVAARPEGRAYDPAGA